MAFNVHQAIRPRSHNSDGLHSYGLNSHGLKELWPACRPAHRDVPRVPRQGGRDRGAREQALQDTNDYTLAITIYRP